MKIHLILIHGAWQGSWVWQALLPYLTQAQINTYPLDLPGNGSVGNTIEDVGADNINMQSYVMAAAKQVLKIEQAEAFNPAEDKIVVLAHSGGGVVATQLAELCFDKISAVIYLAGMMLPSGLSFKALLEELKDQGQDYAGIEKHLVWDQDYVVSQVPPQAGANVFLNDMPFEQALNAAEQLTPQVISGLAIEANWSRNKFGQIPRLYIECSQDLSVKLPVQKMMQQLVPGAECVNLDTGHAPHVSQPELTAQVIVNYLSRFK
ncbi:alpha/beta hydrolase [Catenovulum sp. 2E275]|uniref:alpha/beta fold hydrolase n=1 Tax=Catenovulum sp. 2E275 TaxID=2980497 RepID=UPI0021CE1901|nr:alpha/beta hydrolase [Catenovulum sp. 2E275]MCU4676019.1 alpha/beta hydrolase [Catenovulum sp. 2E275]